MTLLGCWKAPTHGRDPTTARHGNFWLLGFPPGPFRSSLEQPGSAGFLQPIHVDAKLSADTRSTQATIQQDSQPQIIHYTKPPCSRITGKRHKPGEKSVLLVLVIFVKNYLVSLHGLMCYLLTGTFLSPSYAADYFTM